MTSVEVVNDPPFTDAPQQKHVHCVFKVRAERNRARDEVRQLRQRLDTLTKEVSNVRRERQELAVENESLRQGSRSDQKPGQTGDEAPGSPEAEPVRDVDLDRQRSSQEKVRSESVLYQRCCRRKNSPDGGNNNINKAVSPTGPADHGVRTWVQKPRR